MRRSFDLSTQCLAAERSEGGWFITLDLGGGTALRAFFSDELFTVTRVIGADQNHKPIEKDFILIPDLNPGDTVTLAIKIPLKDQ